MVELPSSQSGPYEAEELRSTWGLLDGDLEMKLMCSVTPVICRHLQLCFKSARYRIHCGVPFPFVPFSSEIEDLPVVRYTAPHPNSVDVDKSRATW